MYFISRRLTFHYLDSHFQAYCVDFGIEITRCYTLEEIDGILYMIRQCNGQYYVINY